MNVVESFKHQLQVFTSSYDPDEQYQAIIAMLDPLDLDIEYKKLASEGGLARVLDIFSSFSDTSDDELINDYDKKSLEQVGLLSRDYFAREEYSSFAQMVFALILESFSDYYGLEEGTEVNRSLIYAKISDEIYLQTFLLDTMADLSKFDWNRDRRVIEQSLMVLTVCFSDIYSFLTEEDDDDEMAD